MNEIIRPTGFDLTKNLHGHVRVETRSRWTGKVIDSQEKDNLVTNALQKLVYASAWMSSSGLASWFTPIYSKALGSLLLFGDTLTESADNIFLPNKAPLAIAPYGANADADGGSLNTSESGFISNGYTSVWDFTTSQANGTIASVARTHYNYRQYGELGALTAYYFSGLASGYTTVRFLGYDETNKYLFFSPTASISVSGATFGTSDICRIKKDLEKIDLENCGIFPERIQLVKSLSSSDGTTTAYYWQYDRWENEFVYITGSTLHKIAMDGTHTSSTLSGSGSLSNFAITENYYWRVDGQTAYRISKTNLADVTSYSIQDYSYVIFATGNDVVACGNANNTGTRSYLYVDGTVIRKTGLSNISFVGTPPKEVGILYSGTRDNGSCLYPRLNYLGTIANLDSPVTKTSSQTMKITYTLTEA